MVVFARVKVEGGGVSKGLATVVNGLVLVVENGEGVGRGGLEVAKGEGAGSRRVEPVKVTGTAPEPLVGIAGGGVRA